MKRYYCLWIICMLAALANLGVIGYAIVKYPTPLQIKVMSSPVWYGGSDVAHFVVGPLPTAKGVPGSTLTTSEGKCPPTGDGGDTLTNVLKNRPDTPTSYKLISWSALSKFPTDKTANTNRMRWTPQQLAGIQKYEQQAVMVTGFLYDVNVEDGKSGEVTNCHFKKSANVDWHMYLTNFPTDGEAKSIVVEVTPRIRQQHPKWTIARLRYWIGTGVPVRIAGYTMLDPEHKGMVGTYRITIWEIHPVTMIEVFHAGQWISLDVISVADHQ